jgi:hypothetical protein
MHLFDAADTIRNTPLPCYATNGKGISRLEVLQPGEARLMRFVLGRKDFQSPFSDLELIDEEAGNGILGREFQNSAYTMRILRSLAAKHLLTAPENNYDENLICPRPAAYSIRPQLFCNG